MRRLLALLPLALTAAAPAAAPFTIAETGRSFAHLDEAVRAIGDGQGTIVIAPGTYRECAVQTAGVVTFKASEPGTVIFERDVCEDKAALVLRGRGSAVEGLVFTRRPGRDVADVGVSVAL